MVALTVYNHGTTQDQNNRNNLITLLHNTSIGQGGERVMVTNGVGSGLKVGQAAGLSKVKEALGGGAFGAGIDENVGAATRWVQGRCQNLDVTVLNLCGYSRGAVTCFKIANELRRNGPGRLKDLPVRIFAIDPVPGCSTFVNSHMYKHIELTENVVECKVILAENERRKTFRPVLDRKFFDPNKPETYLWDTIPGNHKGIVEPSATAGDSERIVFDMARRFLREPHPSLKLGGGDATAFSDPTPMPTEEVLGRYSTIMAEYRKYVKQGMARLKSSTGRENLATAGFGSPTDRGGGLSGFAKDRVVRVKTESNSLRANHDYHGSDVVLKARNVGGATAFFVNNDHKTRFECVLPATYHVLLRAERGCPYFLGNLTSQTTPAGRELLAYLYGGGNRHLGPVEDHIRGYLDMFGFRPAW